MLLQAGLEARSVAAFLHENVLEFIADDGIRSAADALEHLSTAGTPPRLTALTADHRNSV